MSSKSVKFRKVLYWIVFSSFLISLIYVSIRAGVDENYRNHTQYELIIFQCILGMIAINLPHILSRKFKWKIPAVFYIIYFIFLFLSIVCGETAKFYYKISVWDDILHLSSSIMLAMVGFSLVDILNNKKEKPYIKLSPLFVSLFALTFAVSIGALWEVFEFTFDGILGGNMQKHSIEAADGITVLEPLIGRDALVDTMTDIIIDFCGAIFVSVTGFICTVKEKKWMNAFKIDVKTDNSESEHETPEIDNEKENALTGSDKDES